MSGIPVVYTNIADPLEYDRYDFVKQRLIPDLEDCATIEDINNFYERNNLDNKLTKIFNLEEKSNQTINRINNFILKTLHL